MNTGRNSGSSTDNEEGEEEDISGDVLQKVCENQRLQYVQFAVIYLFGTKENLIQQVIGYIRIIVKVILISAIIRALTWIQIINQNNKPMVGGLGFTEELQTIVYL